MNLVVLAVALRTKKKRKGKRGWKRRKNWRKR
jgi:hypothetical protein